MLKNSEEAQLLQKRIVAFTEGYRQNISIIGTESSNKEFLLEKIIYENYLQRNVFPIFINLEYITFDEFTRGVCSTLLFHFLKRKQKNCSYDLDSLILETEKLIPATVKEIKETLRNPSRTKKKYSFSDIEKILDTFIKETSLKVIFVMQNFSRLQNFSKKLTSDLAKYIITQKNIMFIFLDKDQKKAENLLSEELNLLFGNFEKISLSNMSSDEADKYFDTTLGKKLPPLLGKFIVDISDCIPLYSDIITDSLKKVPEDKINSDILSKEITDLLLQPRSAIYQILSHKLKILKAQLKDPFLINPLLTLIAQGYTRKKDLLSLLKIRSKDLNSRLNKLLDNKTIKKTGSFYYIPDKLFAFWLSCIFKGKINTPFMFSHDLYDYTNWKIREKLKEFKDNFTKDNFDRFIDLIHLFKNDRIKMNKKSIPLPEIKRFRTIPAHNKDMKFIIGEAENYYLIVAFKEKSPIDTDILEFSNRCSYFRKRQPKKIFITLKEANLTAKVLAKEKKLFFWEKEEVNLLFRLYNKPAIV